MSSPTALQCLHYILHFTLMLLQYGSLVRKWSRMRGQLTSRLYSICHKSGFPRVSDWLSRLLYMYMFACFIRYVYLCNYREMCLWQCAYPYVTEFIYVNAGCFKFIYTCKHVCVQCVLRIWMCNLGAQVWVFVPGYGACGQLCSPEVAAMIYPIPHVLFTR